jgi:hypothetical protein
MWIVSLWFVLFFFACPRKCKVKCTLIQALRLCTGRTAHTGSRVIALLFHDHGTRRGWGVSVTLRPLFTPGKEPVPIVQEIGWAPGPVRTGAENLAPNGIWSPDRPARSQSLYWLSYPAHLFVVAYIIISIWDIPLWSKHTIEWKHHQSKLRCAVILTLYDGTWFFFHHFQNPSLGSTKYLLMFTTEI